MNDFGISFLVLDLRVLCTKQRNSVTVLSKLQKRRKSQRTERFLTDYTDHPDEHIAEAGDENDAHDEGQCVELSEGGPPTVRDEEEEDDGRGQHDYPITAR